MSNIEKYQQLVARLDSHLPKHEYYQLLLTNSTAILVACGLKGKAVVAEELGMSPQVFSTAFQFISAYDILPKTANS